MRFFSFPVLLVRSGWCLATVLFGSSVGASPEWTATAGEMGRDNSSFALHIGGNYAVLSGTEVENVDPSPGVEAGVSYRFLANLSVFGSYAINTSNVEGQLIHLLDQRVRDDGRSGNVEGELQTSRLRIGVRLDALREESWQFRAYLLGAVVFSSLDVTLDKVDGNDPPFLVTGDPPDFPTVDVSSFSDNQLGGLARFGLEYTILTSVSLDLNVSYEVIEFPTGTNALASFNTGLVLRL
jgi:hypothetical protein